MSSTSIASLYSKINDTAIAFVNNFVEAHKARDTSILSANLAPSCRRYLAPASFLKQAPQLAAGWSNAEYELHMQPEIHGYSSVEAKVKDIIVDVQSRKAVVQSLHICTMAGNERVWDFEFMFLLRFGESGTEILEVVEFVDTAVALEMLAANMAESVER